ncbi:hypothetical protein H0A36_24420 [Endozoicomonas sp. SM1973]|uniref:Uncharacterized protein n=1 Tax=Spartinivicinus marinus TaxID=2994442 RepID=A0A853I5J5_9GAMM|nr:hypothetical protein [Spartinivicinus marinus]MCX4029611.1 hypothetical protein [Spartinivicinus marinus]NYZ69170.1 hypothetical protein [Spartinivicinus marinus]
MSDNPYDIDYDVPEALAARLKNYQLTNKDIEYISHHLMVAITSRAKKNGGEEDFQANQLLCKILKVIGDTTIQGGLVLVNGHKITAFSDESLDVDASTERVPTQQAVKTYVDTLANTKANKAGDASQDFAANHLNAAGNMSASGDIAIEGDANFAKSVLVNKTLTVEQELTANDRLACEKDVSIKGNLVTTNVTVDSHLQAQRLTVTEDLVVKGNESIEANLSVAKGLSIGETVTLGSGPVISKISLDGGLSTNSDTHLPTEKAIKTYVDTIANTKANKSGDITQDFMVGKLTIGDELYCKTDANIQNNLTAGSANINQNLQANRITSKGLMVNGDEKVDGYLHVGDVLQVGNTFSLNSGPAINKISEDSSLSGNSNSTIPTEQAIKAYADTKAAKKGDLQQDFNVSSLFVGKNINVDQDVKITGKLSAGEFVGIPSNSLKLLAEPELIRLQTNSGNKVIKNIKVNQITEPATAIMVSITTFSEKAQGWVVHGLGRPTATLDERSDSELMNNKLPYDVMISHYGTKNNKNRMFHGTQIIPLKENNQFDVSLVVPIQGNGRAPNNDESKHTLAIQVYGYF